MDNQRKPSEIIEDFLAFLESANSEHIECGKIVDVCEKRNIDYLHDMEFAKDKGQRNKIATKIHQNQKTRRAAKDRKMELEKTAAFFVDSGNKAFIGKLKRLLKDQRDTEKYLENERTYTRRVGEGE